MYLETNRLIIRNLKPSDAVEYLRFRNSEFVLRYNAMGHQSAEGFRTIATGRWSDVPPV